MNETKTEIGKITLPQIETAAFQSAELSMRCKCVLCGGDSEMKIPNGTPVNGIMTPYVCDKCKAIWKKLSESVSL